MQTMLAITKNCRHRGNHAAENVVNLNGVFVSRLSQSTCQLGIMHHLLMALLFCRFCRPHFRTNFRNKTAEYADLKPFWTGYGILPTLLTGLNECATIIFHKARFFQGFSLAVLSTFGQKCSISGTKHPNMLV